MANAASPHNPVWINGEIVAETEARVSVLDHGFLYGDSAYEAVRTFGGRPFLLDAHLRRLGRSAAGIGITLPNSVGVAVDDVLAASSGERLLRIIVTRGVGPLGYDIIADQPPTLIVLSRPMPTYPTAYYLDGLALAFVGVQRNHRNALDPSLKTSNLLNLRLAHMEARRAGADDAVILNARGEVTEASGSNIFAIRKATLFTPPHDAGILAGCTREFVLREIAPAIGMSVREEPMPPEALSDADEIFITSTTRSIHPVTRLDHKPVGDGRPGPLTRRLMRQFEARVGVPVFPEGSC